MDSWEVASREALLKERLLTGCVPKFLRRFSRIDIGIKADDGKVIKAEYYVSPAYLSIGNSSGFLRVPLTPQTAQDIASHYRCFLPTKKNVDDIYAAAKIKLQPIPLTEKRETFGTFVEHHKLIERQRNDRKELIAGIKKDVVISSAVAKDPRPNRVAIYGWHKSDGSPIQPLYTGYVDWFVDYSHGIRLVYEMIRVAGKWMHYREILNDPLLKRLLCDEEACDVYEYSE
ncbi:hypothetical protein ACFOET_20990 [Parapedobacter deserti]|uniref:Uncharacterized protein n=1 Tax=Parapedobacter deserti TaxID=1912957 RepID=A0ABV7JSX7_9SPHI